MLESADEACGATHLSSGMQLAFEVHLLSFKRAALLVDLLELRLHLWVAVKLPVLLGQRLQRVALKTPTPEQLLQHVAQAPQGGYRRHRVRVRLGLGAQHLQLRLQGLQKSQQVLRHVSVVLLRRHPILRQQHPHPPHRVRQLPVQTLPQPHLLGLLRRRRRAQLGPLLQQRRSLLRHVQSVGRQDAGAQLRLLLDARRQQRPQVCTRGGAALLVRAPELHRHQPARRLHQARVRRRRARLDCGGNAAAQLVALHHLLRAQGRHAVDARRLQRGRVRTPAQRLHLREHVLCREVPRADGHRLALQVRRRGGRGGRRGVRPLPPLLVEALLRVLPCQRLVDAAGERRARFAAAEAALAESGCACRAVGDASFAGGALLRRGAFLGHGRGGASARRIRLRHLLWQSTILVEHTGRSSNEVQIL
eukprot:Rhum_TRINITY_DN7598_c0_g1::Rhum_TRINITY_DN7598_c0_g1_i1::g.23263::m.23263